ncbi:MAG: hypothetical protein Q8865_00050 [Bacillota bacterium]|nr:hypothetical protein [Bacillota bacterium]
MKLLYRTMLILHAFIGIGGMAGGLGAITNPNLPMGVSTELLKNSPFSNYLIPGILLFSVIGIGNVIASVGILCKFKWQGYLSSVFSWALVIWIIVQCIMLRMVATLHIVFFFIGVIEAALSAVMLFKERLFPTNIILKLLKK